MSLSANSNIYVSSQLALTDCLSLQYACPVIFDLMPMWFTWLGARYFCDPTSIIERCFGIRWIYWKQFDPFDVCFYDLLSRSGAGVIITPEGRTSWMPFPMSWELRKFFQPGSCEQALCRHHALLTNPLGCLFLILPQVVSSYALSVLWWIFKENPLQISRILSV